MELEDKLSMIGCGFHLMSPVEESLQISEIVREACEAGVNNHRVLAQIGGWFREYENFVLKSGLLDRILPGLSINAQTIVRNMAERSSIKYLLEAMQSETLSCDIPSVLAAPTRKLKRVDLMIKRLELMQK